MRGILITALVAAIASTAQAQAQDYPTKPVTIVVPFAPGGPTDITARALGSELTKLLGQQFMVENKPGAGSRLGAKQVAAAAPDGYTLLWGSDSSLVIAPLLYKDAGYDGEKSFAPVSLGASSPLLIVVGAEVPAKSLQELVALARREPGKLNFASAGSGSSPHMAGEMLKAAAGIDLVHVPYKGGAPARDAVLAGDAQLTFLPIAVVGPFIAAGKLRALAVADTKRHALLPEVPTTAEAGMPGVVSTAWFGLVAPAGPPPAIVNKLSEAMRKAVAAPETRERFAKLGFDAVGSTPSEFATFMAEERARYKRVVDAAGIRGD